MSGAIARDTASTGFDDPTTTTAILFPIFKNIKLLFKKKKKKKIKLVLNKLLG
jgi:hypothetical protein